jgi:hypothetical protein
MRPDISERQYHTLAYTIVFAATGWIQNASPYYDEALPKIPLASALGDIIHPYFTREGLKRAQQFNSG